MLCTSFVDNITFAMSEIEDLFAKKYSFPDVASTTTCDLSKWCLKTYNRNHTSS